MEEIKVTDALALLVKASGIETFFSVTGGAAVHLVQSLSHAGELKSIFNHHEQASALAADAQGRATGLGLCVTTTGPGVSNAITGLITAWQDSVPVFFISGQSRQNNLGLNFAIRQGGTQHLNVGNLVKRFCKEFELVQDEQSLPAKFFDLFVKAQTGRPGPVWLDIPLDIQLRHISSDLVNSHIAKIKAFNGIENKQYTELNKALIDKISLEIGASHSPLFIFGRGISTIKIQDLSALIEKFNFPIVTTWGAINSNIETHPNFIGRIGMSGQRSANKLVSESDYIIIVGSRLNQSTTGSEIDAFAKDAKLVYVDIDESEISYLKSRKKIQGILCDGIEFIKMLSESSNVINTEVNKWKERASNLKKFNLVEYQNLKKNNDFMDQYEILRLINDHNSNKPYAIVIDGGGTIVYSSMQVMETKLSRKVFLPAASAPMGTGLPFLEGVLESKKFAYAIALIGDGSLMFNVQELQTIKTHKYPCLILVLNNNGYRSIRSTQSQFLDSNYLGSSALGGLELPNFKKLAKVFGIKYKKIKKGKSLSRILSSIENLNEPYLCEIIVDPNQEIYPRVGFELQSDGSYKPATLGNMFPNRPDFF
jgi:acetolactate synthase-1/2/3 large subunit